MKILAAGDKVADVPSRPHKLKILAAGDIHGDRDAVKKLAEKAVKEDVDLVLLSGDLTYGEMHIEGLLGPFIKAGKKVVIIPGNHETEATVDFLAEQYGAVNLHGKNIQIGDVSLFGVGLANVGILGVNPPSSESELYYLLYKSFKGIKSARKTVMVTHVHPDGTLMNKLGYFPGSKAVRQFIESRKPDFAICSHIHEAEGIEEELGKTKIMNVGKQGKVIEV